MLRIKTLGLALVAAVVMSAVAVASASAAHEWQINGKAIATPVKVHSLGLLLLSDRVLGATTRLHCHGFDAGTVGPGGHDLIEKITTTLLGTNERFHCTVVSAGNCNANKLILALPLHLPWLTLIKLVGTEVRDLVEKDGSGGNPGWKVVCFDSVFGTETTDECTKATNTTGLANVAAGVEAKFDAITEPTTCTKGEANQGKVEGTDLIENPGAGETLTFT